MRGLNLQIIPLSSGGFVLFRLSLTFLRELDTGEVRGKGGEGTYDERRLWSILFSQRCTSKSYCIAIRCVSALL